MPLTDSSFDEAWKLLESQYEVRRHIVYAQFQLFYSIPKMKKESANDLRNMMRIILECESGFKTLKLSNDALGSMMVHYCAMQMDPETSRNWEIELKGEKNEPKLNQLTEFLKIRCRLLANIEKNNSQQHETSVPKTENRQPKSAKTFLSQATNEKKLICFLCDEAHRVYKCPLLLNASIDERNKMITDKRLCYNCLGQHLVSECRSKYKCHVCKKRHSVLLHVDEVETIEENQTFSAHVREQRDTLLATARIPVYKSNGETVLIRALIDQGSTSNFITQNVAQVLRAQRYPIDSVVTSINETQTGTIKSYVNLTFGSLHDKEYRYTCDALVLPKITKIKQLSSRAQVSNWSYLHGLDLADPNCVEPGEMDMLIGAEVYAEIILNGLISSMQKLSLIQISAQALPASNGR